jgi:hypothetical protein
MHQPLQPLLQPLHPSSECRLLRLDTGAASVVTRSPMRMQVGLTLQHLELGWQPCSRHVLRGSHGPRAWRWRWRRAGAVGEAVWLEVGGFWWAVWRFLLLLLLLLLWVGAIVRLLELVCLVLPLTLLLMAPMAVVEPGLKLVLLPVLPERLAVM